MVQLEALNAEFGDCLLVHYEAPRPGGGAPLNQLWLIDGGPKGTYTAVLRDRLSALGGGSGGALPIRLGVVTHIDDDHIDGMVGLTRALTANPTPAKTPKVKFTDFWFNGFVETFGSSNSGSQASVAALASDGGMDALLGGMPFDAAAEATAFLQGVADGVELIGHVGKPGFDVTLNAQFPANPPKAVAQPAPIEITRNVADVVVLAPSQKALDDLKVKWAKDTKTRAALQAVLGGRVDKSVANLSSIVMLATIHGKTILLTGDALADRIVDGWRAFKGKPAGKMTPHPIDIMKVPHHGSEANNSLELFELFPARHYVFCANGRHDNPDMKTLKGLFAARPDGPYTLHMTFTRDNAGTRKQAEFVDGMAAASGGSIKVVYRKEEEPSVVIAL
jgi:hypothetical protein